MNKERKRTILTLAPLLIFALLPLGISGTSYNVFIIILFFTWAIVSINLNLLLGYAGVYFIAPGVFFGVGGYVAGFLATQQSLPPFLGLLIGGGFAVVASLIIGLPTLRMKGLYVALFSIIFQLLIATVFVQTNPIISNFSGGPYGIIKIPDIAVGEFGFRSNNSLPYYYLLFAIFIASAIVSYRLVHSKIGRGFRGLRDAENLASAIGISAFRYKLLAFMVSAFFMGIVGGVFANFFGVIGLDVFGFNFLMPLLVMVILGGLGTFYGPILGALIITLLNEQLLLLGVFRFVVLGAVIIVVLIWSPTGIAGKIEEFIQNRRARRSVIVTSKSNETGVLPVKVAKAADG